MKKWNQRLLNSNKLSTADQFSSSQSYNRSQISLIYLIYFNKSHPRSSQFKRLYSHPYWKILS